MAYKIEALAIHQRHSTLHGRERSVFNEANIGTVSRAALGRLLRDRAEHVWAFWALQCHLAETETESETQRYKNLLASSAITSSSSSASPSYISGVHHIGVRFLCMWPFFNPTIRVVTFRLRGWCVLGVFFVSGIHPSRTWTSGSFESVRWNACVHRLDLGFYSCPKEFWGEWSLNPC